MAETTFREYSPSDIPALISLWTEVFGDSSAAVSAFFRVLPEFGTCFVAECGADIIGMASVLTDFLLKDSDDCKKCAYIYAVAVDRRFRRSGIGGTLSCMAADHGRRYGADIICTLPANDALYAMYEKTVGLDKTLFRKKVSCYQIITGIDSLLLHPVSPENYNRKREELLSSLPHLSVSDSSIAFLKALCLDNGGDLYYSDSCCAALYVNGDEVFFTELICSEQERETILSYGAAMKNASSAYCFIPSQEGEKSIAYSGESVYHNPIWNITFE